MESKQKLDPCRVQRKVLIFTAPGAVAVESETMCRPTSGQVLVVSKYSAVSAGTGMLVYRGQMPLDIPTDSIFGHQCASFKYPATYGYCVVGHVARTGDDPQLSFGLTAMLAGYSIVFKKTSKSISHTAFSLQLSC